MRPYKRVLVCGGRQYRDSGKVDEILTAVDPGLIIEGGARGADALARQWGYSKGVHVCTVPALWELYGKGAGPYRNTAMLMLRPSKVVAFHGGEGTADMVRQAKAAGIEVLEVP